MHPLVVGEIALGHLNPRQAILSELERLPQAVVASHREVLSFIDGHALIGLGLGFVDVHLLAATRLTSGAILWSRDRRLARAAENLGVAYAG